MSNAKIAAAVVGGYVLGRTKKGKAAIRLAMWVSGNSDKLNALTKNEQIAALVGQVQGPVLEAVQQAALNTATARMNALSDALGSRTEALSQAGDVTSGIGGKVTKSVSGAGKSLTGRLPKRKGKDEFTDEPNGDDMSEFEDQFDDEREDEDAEDTEGAEDEYDDEEDYEDDYDEDEDDEEEDEEPAPPPRKAAAKKQPAKKAAKKQPSKRSR